MKLIEFVIYDLDKKNENILLINIEDICSFEQTDNQNIVKLRTKTNNTFNLIGNYKTLTNRYFYTISKKTNLYEDDIIRPSIRIYHRNELIDCDSSFIDAKQMEAFIVALSATEEEKKALLNILFKQL